MNWIATANHHSKFHHPLWNAILLAVLLLVPLASLDAADAWKPTNDVVWPPESMKTLPAEYLDRLRHALQLESDKFNDPRFNKNDVVKLRVAIAGLALGQHVDELNTFFETEDFKYEPSENWGFSLFSAPYVRLYALFNDRTGVMKGRLSPKF